MCLINSSSVNLEKVLETSETIGDFGLVWKAVYRVLSAAFHKRSTSIVLSKIPVSKLVVALLVNIATV
jgi:hypothetical protein